MRHIVVGGQMPDERVTEKPMKKNSKVGGTSMRHVVLGILAQRPMSGYDIKRLLGGLSWLVDSPSFGSLYPGLHALLADGLVTVEVVPSDSRPPRKVYTITEAGRCAFQEWVGQRVQMGSSLRQFVIVLSLAGNLSATELHDYLEQRREHVASRKPGIEQALSTASEAVDLGQYLTLDFGRSLADAELAWLDRTLAWLARRPQSVGVAGA
jgi:DNA-binding PadR family transcriptional regulator